MPNSPTHATHEGFTPGPWEIDSNLQLELAEICAGEDWVCDCALNNARLIAAAPTLLADNERLRKRVADLEEMLDEADDELWLTYPNGETNTPAANLRERIRAALALAGQKGNEHGT